MEDLCEAECEFYVVVVGRMKDLCEAECKYYEIGTRR